MKKALSLLLSVVMLISITAGLDLSAYAATSDDYTHLATFIPLDGQWSSDIWKTSDADQWFKITIPNDGKLILKVMSYKDATTFTVRNHDLTHTVIETGDYHGVSKHDGAVGTETAPGTLTCERVLTSGDYYMNTRGAYGKYKICADFISYNTNDYGAFSYDSPLNVPLNYKITGAITETDAEDWYLIDVKNPGYYTLKIISYKDSTTFSFRNADLTQTIIETGDYHGVGSHDGVVGYETVPTTKNYNVALGTGKYYINVRGATGKYCLTWSGCIHEYEIKNVSANCKNQGSITKTCKTCGDSKREIVPKTAHTYKTTTTKATTNKNGSIVTKCSVCGAKKSSTTIYSPKTITLSTTSYTYNGKVKTPSVTVKDSKGKTLKKNTDYTVTYSKGRKAVGKYNVTIKFKGNYSGTVTKNFTIKPTSTSISKLTKGNKKFTVKWKKQTVQTTGYQIQYATDSKFTKNKKTVTIGKNKTTSKTISNLKANKKYHVRVRTYKTVNGTKIYSSWSKVKTVTTKK